MLNSSLTVLFDAASLDHNVMIDAGHDRFDFGSDFKVPPPPLIMNGDGLDNLMIGADADRSIMMHGHAGNDIMVGGDFADRIYGGKGADRIYLGDGDTGIGGKGADHFAFVMNNFADGGHTTIGDLGSDDTVDIYGIGLHATPVHGDTINVTDDQGNHVTIVGVDGMTNVVLHEGPPPPADAFMVG